MSFAYNTVMSGHPIRVPIPLSIKGVPFSEIMEQIVILGWVDTDGTVHEIQEKEKAKSRKMMSKL
jgi:hypothetical protein